VDDASAAAADTLPDDCTRDDLRRIPGIRERYAFNILKGEI